MRLCVEFGREREMLGSRLPRMREEEKLEKLEEIVREVKKAREENEKLRKEFREALQKLERVILENVDSRIRDYIRSDEGRKIISLIVEEKIAEREKNKNMTLDYIR